MKSIRKQYGKELFKEFGYHSTWLPNIRLNIGDIGIVENHQFTKISSLKNMNLAFETEIDPSPTNFDYVSKEGVSIQTKLSGSVQIPNSLLSIDDSGLIVEFLKAYAILFKATGSVSMHLSNKLKLGRDIIKHFEKGLWDINWVIVTEVVKADSSTIIIGNSKQGKIELKANTNVNQSGLANLQANFTTIHHQNIATQFITETELTPLFKLMGIKGMKPFKQTFASKTFGKMAFEPQQSISDRFKFDEILPYFED